MNRTKLLSLLLVLGATGPLGAIRATPALANPNQVSIMMDDDLLVNGTDARRDKALKQMKALGAEYVRATVLWSVIAPAKRPAGFDAKNPASYPHHNWDRFDNLVRSAQANGLGVYLDVTGPGPRWAMGKAPAKERKSAATWMPNPIQFYKFVYAVGKRYSGVYHKELPKDHGILPRVAFWSIWNEPNQGGWLTPQSYRSPTLGKVIPYAPFLYRRLYQSGRLALTATGHDKDFIAIGETSPTGRGAPTSRNPIAPKLFIRELLCVNPQGVPFTGAEASARHCSDFAKYGPLRAAGWAHHPYTRKNAPTAPPPADGITIANLPDLSALLDQLAVTTGDIQSSVPGGLSILASEFGYESNPPDPFAGVPLDTQASWINQGDFLAFTNPRVVGMTQFLLRDATPNRKHPKGTKAYWDTYQSGLLNNAGHRKPAFAAYMLPLVLYPAGKDATTGQPITAFWGQLRFRPQNFGNLTSPDYVQLEYQPTGASTWSPLGAPVAIGNGHHFFGGAFPKPASGLVRATWRAHVAPFLVSSRAVPVPADSTPYQLP
ncbi:MAG: cellulase family glycosylhydrolase [Actinobacteria bacterium]|nr:cellulase family glycosylhydrolase [Actinomycetota bacterium]